MEAVTEQYLLKYETAKYYFIKPIHSISTSCIMNNYCTSYDYSMQPLQVKPEDYSFKSSAYFLMLLWLSGHPHTQMIHKYMF